MTSYQIGQPSLTRMLASSLRARLRHPLSLQGRRVGSDRCVADIFVATRREKAAITGLASAKMKFHRFARAFDISLGYALDHGPMLDHRFLQIRLGDQNIALRSLQRPARQNRKPDAVEKFNESVVVGGFRNRSVKLPVPGFGRLAIGEGASEFLGGSKNLFFWGQGFARRRKSRRMSLDRHAQFQNIEHGS